MLSALITPLSSLFTSYMEKKTEEACASKRTGWSIGGIFMVGSMFVGMGLGQYFGERQIGMYIGLGIGFIGMAVIHLIYPAKS